MDVVVHPDADSFFTRAWDFLAAREAEHNLIFGIGGRLRAEPEPNGSPAYLATVERDGDVVAAALRTPPHNVILAETDELEAITALAADLAAADPSLPGVLGSKAVAARFVDAWGRVTGADARVAIAERIYCCERVVPPEGVPGRMRAYEERDRELVVGWFCDFAAEAMPDAPVDERAEDVLDRRLAEPEGGIRLWVDDDAVCVAGFGGSTPNGIRIGPVYTPPERRRRGYAAALTAALTTRLLEGRRFCFLFTDLANPTSNSVYTRIGYEPVADVDQWAFTKPATRD